jgi:hypothetical protein
MKNISPKSLLNNIFSKTSGGGGGFDADAAAYIAAVEAVDTAALEAGVKTAINAFVVGCKADGIWSAIKASCILSGARTLSGALVPLAGTAPTNFNFVSGDYNRKTGLVGDGTSKYLNSNRNNNADPQNSCHSSVCVTTVPSAVNYAFYLGVNGLSSSAISIFLGGPGSGTNNDLFTRMRSATGRGVSSQGRTLGFKGTSRSVNASYIIRSSNINTTVSEVSASPTSVALNVYADQAGSAAINARLAFYSIGESLDLTLLDARVTALITAFGVAIP